MNVYNTWHMCQLIKNNSMTKRKDLHAGYKIDGYWWRKALSIGGTYSERLSAAWSESNIKKNQKSVWSESNELILFWSSNG